MFKKNLLKYQCGANCGNMDLTLNLIKETVSHVFWLPKGPKINNPRNYFQILFQICWDIQLKIWFRAMMHSARSNLSLVNPILNLFDRCCIRKITYYRFFYSVPLGLIAWLRSLTNWFNAIRHSAGSWSPAMVNSAGSTCKLYLFKNIVLCRIAWDQLQHLFVYISAN
jgi:hypothetical protein